LDFRGARQRRAKARAHHDRCRPFEGAPDSGEPVEKGAVPRRIGRTKGGLNSKLHAVCDGEGKRLVLLVSEGQMSDHKGARLILDALPPAKALLADRGYDSNWFRHALAKRGGKPCIPSTKSRKIPLPYDKALYKQRHTRSCLQG
jgi:transposase